jgi:hypothetical protein
MTGKKEKKNNELWMNLSYEHTKQYDLCKNITISFRKRKHVFTHLFRTGLKCFLKDYWIYFLFDFMTEFMM